VPGVKPHIDLLDRLSAMHRMRAFEEAVGVGVAAGEIHGEMHLGLGQEAIAAGIEPLLRPGDAVVSSHRPHLHALAHGVEPVGLLAELFERDGMCAGKGGHMHLFSRDRPFMCTGIVGAQPPIALGYAFAARHRRGDDVAVAVIGEGATAIGGFSESLNLASLWKLPVLFLVEDNGYGISVPKALAVAGELAARGSPFGIPGFACDGTDLEAVFHTAHEALAHVREGQAALLVASCYRYAGHYEGDADRYRDQVEKDAAKAADRDPIGRLRARLVRAGHDEAALDALEARAYATVAGWVDEAKARPYPDPETAAEGVFL
jgi:acetoin:2,6-dichlorophenolindophenol oxidoreductase subunit alpha